MTNPDVSTPSRSRRWLSTLWGITFLWLLVMAFVSGGWRKAALVFVVTMVVASVLGTAAGMISLSRRQPWQVVAALMIFTTLGWFYFTGSYKSWTAMAWDISGMALGMLAGWTMWQLSARFRNRLPQRVNVWLDALPADFTTIGSLLAAWIGITVLTVARTPLLPANLARFETLGAAHSIVPAQATQWTDLRVGLALSGGGYRAAVMHTGTLHALETLGIRVNALSTVSGGSIIGAYYALGGDPVAFKDAVAAGRFNLKRELLLIHNAVRLPFPLTVPGVDIKLFPFYDFNRRDVQVGVLDRMLYAQRESWRTPTATQPLLMMAATDLTFGLTVGLLPDGLLTITTAHDIEAYRANAALLSSDLSLAQRVAVSGAFPVAFPPLRIGAKVTPLLADGRGTRPLLLADGGIADNSGLNLLIAAGQVACSENNCASNAAWREHFLDPQWALDVYLASDGGAIFGVEQDVEGVGSLARAFDVGGARSDGQFKGDNVPVYFSAQRAYLDPGKQFRMYGDGPVMDHTKLWNAAFDPWGLPEPILEEIIRLLPDASRADGLSALTNYLRDRAPEDSVRQKQWSRTIESFKHVNDCRKLLSSPAHAGSIHDLPGICDAVELRLAIHASFKEALEAFRATSTLDDQLSPERVDDLYRLGQMLVYMNWRELDRTMSAALSRRRSTDRTQ